MAQPRVFTLEEVDALIPKLAILVERQLERETHIEQSLARLVRLNEGTRTREDLPRSRRKRPSCVG